MADGLRSLIVLIGPLAAAFWIAPVVGLWVHAGHGDTPATRTLLYKKPGELIQKPPNNSTKQKLMPEARKSAKQKPLAVKTKSLAVAKKESPEAAGNAGTLPGGEPYRYILLGPWNGSRTLRNWSQKPWTTTASSIA